MSSYHIDHNDNDQQPSTGSTTTTVVGDNVVQGEGAESIAFHAVLIVCDCCMSSLLALGILVFENLMPEFAQNWL